MSEGLLRPSDVKLALNYMAAVAGIGRLLKLYGKKRRGGDFSGSKAERKALL